MTKEAGLAVTMYGMGATVGDYDNDGWPDLFVTGVGGNRLFHNDADANGAGGRRFVDTTATAGVGGPGGWPNALSGSFFQWNDPLCFSTSASFLDYDGDGKLDLFVCNYVHWSPAYDLSINSTLDGKERTYGQPKLFDGALCFLYHNEGDGKFADVSKESGVQVFEKQGTDANAPLRPVGKSLGVIVCDADEDGWPDIFVANDTMRNFLFHNQPGTNGERVFKEEGMYAGVAYAEGNARGAMGIDWAPFYRRGCNGLLIGNFANEPDTFLCQDDPKRLVFSDKARSEGIAGPSRMLLKFGAFFFDYDLDGRLDFLTNNGHLDPSISKLQAGQQYAQPPQLFWSKPKQGFQEVTAADAGRRPVPTARRPRLRLRRPRRRRRSRCDSRRQRRTRARASQRQPTRPSLDSSSSCKATAFAPTAAPSGADRAGNQGRRAAPRDRRRARLSQSERIGRDLRSGRNHGN